MEKNLNELFGIDHSSELEVVQSFERISKELLNCYSLKINDSTFLFTEIEFYYFYKGVHEDENTHEHEFKSGMWRCHNVGLDITFESILPDVCDGGILIRGIKQVEPFTEKPFVNGPRRVINKIFDNLNDVMSLNTGINLFKLPRPLGREIFRTSRQNVKEETYKDSKYRYFTEQKEWKSKQWDGKYNFSNDKITDVTSWEQVK
jgi:hypothetical protein